mmetsp:Transcript_95764/g.276618  ORF Transcript_95764/g.276618 Transcript_95764/m.276618 type:complete len:280 (+) Transcript_95764:831-1670(+)
MNLLEKTSNSLRKASNSRSCSRNGLSPTVFQCGAVPCMGGRGSTRDCMGWAKQPRNRMLPTWLPSPLGRSMLRMGMSNVRSPFRPKLNNGTSIRACFRQRLPLSLSHNSKESTPSGSSSTTGISADTPKLSGDVKTAPSLSRGCKRLGAVRNDMSRNLATTAASTAAALCHRGNDEGSHRTVTLSMEIRNLPRMSPSGAGWCSAAVSIAFSHSVRSCSLRHANSNGSSQMSGSKCSLQPWSSGCDGKLTGSATAPSKLPNTRCFAVSGTPAFDRRQQTN